MTRRIVPIAALALMLAGCSTRDWDDAAAYVGLQEVGDKAMPPAPAPPAAVPAESPVADSAGPDNDIIGFCKGVGKSEADMQAGYGNHDPEALRRIAERSFRECVATESHGTRLN